MFLLVGKRLIPVSTIAWVYLGDDEGGPGWVFLRSGRGVVLLEEDEKAALVSWAASSPLVIRLAADG
jgi:hypothetical protein